MTAITRGWLEAQQNRALSRMVEGLSTNKEALRDFYTIQNDIDAAGQPDQAGTEAIDKAVGVGGTLRAMAANPSATASKMGQALGSSPASVVGQIGGALVGAGVGALAGPVGAVGGAVAGSAVGAGAGSAADTHGQAIREALQRKGVDFNDWKQVYAAVKSSRDELRNEARTRAGVSGVVNGAFAALPIPMARALGGSTAGKVANVIAQPVVNAASAVADPVAQAVAVDQPVPDANALTQAAAMGAGMGAAVDIPVSVVGRALPGKRPTVEEQPRAVAPEPIVEPVVEQAVAPAPIIAEPAPLLPGAPATRDQLFQEAGVEPPPRPPAGPAEPIDPRIQPVAAEPLQASEGMPAPRPADPMGAERGPVMPADLIDQRIQPVAELPQLAERPLGEAPPTRESVAETQQAAEPLRTMPEDRLAAMEGDAPQSWDRGVDALPENDREAARRVINEVLDRYVPRAQRELVGSPREVLRDVPRAEVEAGAAAHNMSAEGFEAAGLTRPAEDPRDVLIRMHTDRTETGARRTAAHEAYHALVAMKAHTSVETATLTREAKRAGGWADQFGKPKTARGLEEAIAVAHERYEIGTLKDMPPRGSVIARAFEKMSAIYRAIKAFVTRGDNPAPREVLERAASGEVGKRPLKVPETAARGEPVQFSIREDIEETKRAFSAQKEPSDGVLRTALNFANNTAGKVLYSNDGALRTIGEINKLPAVAKLADKLFVRPGKLGAPAAGPGYHQIHEQMRQSMVNKATEHLRGLSRAEIDQFGRLLRADAKMPAKFQKAADDLRSWLREFHAEARKAGINIGDQGDRYLPRLYDHLKIVADPEAFRAKAAEAYKVTARENMVKAAAEAVKSAGVTPEVAIRDARKRYAITDAEAAQLADAWVAQIKDATLGITKSIDPTEFAANSTRAKPERARSLAPEADKILGEFMIQDPVEIIQGYAHRMSERIAYARQFGAEGEKLKALFQEIRDQGGAKHLPEIMGYVASNLGQLSSLKPNAVISGMQTVGTFANLANALISSIPEASTVGIRSMNPLRIPGDVMRSFLYFAKGPDNVHTTAADMARAAGIITNGLNQATISMARAGFEYHSKIQAFMLHKLFQMNGLERLTQAQRVVATHGGMAFIDSQMRAAERGSKPAAGYLRELGISQGDRAKVKEFLARGATADNMLAGTRPELSPADGARTGAEIYRDALYRFVDQTIMQPNRAVKPKWASTQIGGMVYSISSFLYAFQKNVINRVGNITWEATKGSVGQSDVFSPAQSMKVAAQLSLSLAGLYAMTGAVQALRNEFINAPESEEARKKRAAKGQSDDMKLAIDTLNAVGFGPIGARVKGVMDAPDFGTSLANQMVGPTLSTLVVNPVDRVSKALANKSTVSNTADRNAVTAVNRATLNPAVTAGLSLAPGVLRVPAAGASLAINSGKGRDAVTSAIAGPRQTRQQQNDLRAIQPPKPPGR